MGQKASKPSDPYSPPGGSASAPSPPAAAEGLKTADRRSSFTLGRSSMRGKLESSGDGAEQDKPWIHPEYQLWLAGERARDDKSIFVLSSARSAPVPLLLGAGVSIATVTCGNRHAAALSEHGELFTWGQNDFGQLGRGAVGGASPFPERVLFALHLHALEPKLAAVSCGARHTAAVTDQSLLLTFGDNSSGQCGYALGAAAKKIHVVTRPVDLAPPLHCVRVACGDAHTLAIAVSGEVWAFGDNAHGQLGVGDVVARPVPAIIEGLLGIPVASVSAGAMHSGAVSVCGSVYMWGSNRVGQLGVADVDLSPVPYSLQFFAGLEACVVLCAASHSLVMTRNGTVYGYGDCSRNQIGLRSATREVPPSFVSKRPMAVEGLAGPACALAVCDMGGAAIVWNAQSNARELCCWGEVLTASGLTERCDGGGGAAVPGAPVALCVGGGMGVCGVWSTSPAAATQGAVPLPDAPFPALDGPTMARMLQMAKQSRSSLRIFSQYLQFAMSHPSGLNASFLHPAQRFKQSGVVSGMEMAQVRATFIEIQKLASPLLYNAMLEGAGAAVQYLYDYRLAHSPEIVRMFLVLLDSPVLLNPDARNRKLLDQILFCMLGLPTLLKTTLLSYLGEYAPPFFVMPVQVFERYLSYLVQTGGNERSIYNCVLFLSHLNQINEVKRHIPYQQLYNEQLNALPTPVLEQEYWRWRNRQFSFCQYPFLLGASCKSELLQIDAQVSMKEQMESAILSSVMRGEAALPFLVLVVRREALIADALAQIGSKPPEVLKKPLKIKFIGEEGIDAGGVKKEFFQLITRAMLDPMYGMFLYNDTTRTFWFNMASTDMAAEYGLVGTMLGLAIYNSVILDLPFPMIVYKKLCNKPLELEDVRELESQTYKNLKALLDYAGDDVEDVFCLDFQVSYDYFGARKTVDLAPGGAAMAVTQSNKHQYVKVYVQWLLEGSIATQFDAFARGFRMVGGPTLSIFRPEELELLVCGSETVNIDELESTTTYKGGFAKDHKVVRWFWLLVRSWPVEKQKKLLTFATGSDRIPIKGLAHMGFVLQSNTADTSRLPTASTCFNTLLLPAYSSYDQLRDKLDYAVENAAQGFSLK